MYHDLATFTIDCYGTAKAVPLSKTNAKAKYRDPSLRSG